jgi:nitroimidazol reductase NimA-like FMN-containing flavoprotein (pyridoxamine 5'-phosphate oxidase superfamily)
MAEISAEEKQSKIDALLGEPLLARLATSNAKTNQPHVVPVWFLWDGESIWISGFSSTRKIRELMGNPRCAVLVEPPPDSKGMQAVLLEGKAELIREPREFVAEMALRIYTHYLGPEGVLAADPQSWAHDPESLLVKLTPEKTYTW